MPIIPDNLGVHPYMQAVSAFTELIFQLSGLYRKSEGNEINGQDHINIISLITSEMDKILTNELYDIFYTQYKGTLIGLNIRYKEYKGTPEEQEWLNNIIEDSADLLGLVKQQFETELQREHQHTIITLGLYTEVCIFRATVMSARKYNYQINRDVEVKDMLQECKEKLDIVIEKSKRIYDNKKIIADTCEEPPPDPGRLILFSCYIYEHSVREVWKIISDLEKQKSALQSAISIILL